MALVMSGVSDYHTAKRTGISRGTVRRWRLSEVPPQSVLRSRLAATWMIEDQFAYCYLLGAYLGDGTVCSPNRGGLWLQIVNDRRYPSISQEILRSMAVTFPGARPRSHRSSVGESDVLCITHPAMLKAFPQHGPGRKHLRRIILEDWQLALTHKHPDALIRGLIHSDGCRTENRFRTKLPSGRVADYAYVRYFFSNLSADIRQIFIDHCELLGVRVTQSNHRNLSVSHRHSVAILERLIGAKS
jgi:hypothetical protein